MLRLREAPTLKYRRMNALTRSALLNPERKIENFIHDCTVTGAGIQRLGWIKIRHDW